MWSVEPLSQTDEAYALRVLLDAKNREIEKLKNDVAQLKAVLTTAQRNALVNTPPTLDVWASIRALDERINRLEGKEA
jgi:hypothetical protein